MKLFPPTTLRHVSHLSLKPKKPDSDDDDDDDVRNGQSQL